MIYVFNKAKILTYIAATCFVLMLFAFKTDTIPNRDVELVKVSTNVVGNINSSNNIINN